MEKNLHIKPGDKCIFVDIGFAGSMVAPIKSALPENEVEFEFLIATSNKAKGFIANSELPLENFESEKHHLGTRWLEETHHGTLASAKRLIRNDKGEIEVVFDSSGFRSEKHPLKVRIDPKFSLPYLIRKFCLKSVVESAAALPPQSKEVKENARKKLGDLMGQLLNGELPMLLGWDK